MTRAIRFFARDTTMFADESIEAFEERVNKVIEDEDLIVMNMQVGTNDYGAINTITLHVEQTNRWQDDTVTP